MKYKTLNEHYKEKYGCKVYKLSLNAGLGCPNRDGTVGDRGCNFCSETGSGEFAEKLCGDVASKLEAAKKRVEAKNKSGKYIAYFQAFTNTYAEVEVLKEMYYSAISPEFIVGLSVATRPDCLSDEVVALLSEVNKIKPVSVELGLQTVNENSVKYIRRGYENSVYKEAVKRLKAENIEVVTHVIIGLPFETVEDCLATTRFAVESGTDGIKFHLLHVLKDTDLCKDYTDGKFECLSLPEYAEMLSKCIAILPQGIVVHRITGDGDKRKLVAPLWSADKKKVLNFLKEYLEK